MDIKPEGREVGHLVACGPNGDATKEEWDSFENDLQVAAESVKPEREVMVLGGLNAGVGNNVETSCDHVEWWVEREKSQFLRVERGSWTFAWRTV